MKLSPNYKKIHKWEDYSHNIMLEYKQCLDEGLDIEKYRQLFDAAANIEAGEHRASIGNSIFEIVLNAKTKEGYTYNEPSDLESIQKLLNDPPKLPKYDTNALKDRIQGAWLGRTCGCLLGKPIEGIRTNELIKLLKSSNNFPLHRYIVTDDITDEMYSDFEFRLRGRCFADTVTFAPYDDDTNYTVLYQMVIEKYGRDFTPENVGEAWLDLQPKRAYCTAERVAFINLAQGFQPPATAIYKNPFREWIGAQIRGDYFGYINPGDPKTAAEMAWRDASISHVKNGIYGEMFASAMLACAACDITMEEIVLGGLSQVPKTSRLYKKIMDIVDMHSNGKSAEDCFEYIHEQYDEYTDYGWCHTIPNAMIVATALLYGDCDYGKSICMAVETGFDTDCNGATVGSVIGMRYGIKAIDEKWSKPINGIIETTIFSVEKISIADAANITLSHIK